MSLTQPSNPSLACALQSALSALAAQRERLNELRALGGRKGKRLVSESRSADEDATSACMEALYAQTLDFSVAGLTEVIEDLEVALDAAAVPAPRDLARGESGICETEVEPGMPAVSVHLRLVDL